MSQITIYLDDETQARMKCAAKAANVSVSRWLASLVREKTSSEWPENVRSSAGAWADFPELSTLRGNVTDLPRESL